MTVALILSGGNGIRFGSDLPKQYVEVNGRPVISYCIEQLLCHQDIDYIQIVAAKQWHNIILNWIDRYDCPQTNKKRKFHGFSLPGENRQLSIYYGLTDILSFAQELDTVLIHDAARPLLSEKLITDCLRAVQKHDGVLPVLPMKDTIYESTNGKTISTLLNREKVYAGQAPEAFRLGLYYNANKELFPDKILRINGSTEPAVLAGMDIAMIPGEETNFKITTKADLDRFLKIVAQEN